ncbi:MAG: 4'-phosphopantetheinyl transferase superfamily protein [Deltaproteobacteria bacterium]
MSFKGETRKNHPAHFISDETEVHLWICRFQSEANATEECYEEIISADERKRADRFRFNEERSKFIQARGVLRTVLGKYLNLRPNELVFDYNKYGKPGLQARINPRNVKFNLSHSRSLAIYAVTKDREVGVDVEYLRDVKRADKIIERFFSQHEREFYGSRPSAIKKLAFFQLWTRKEAYTKAMGAGISLPRDDYTLSLIPGDSSYRNNRSPVTGNNRKWSLYDIEIDENYKAALAVEGEGHDIRYFSLI